MGSSYKQIYKYGLYFLAFINIFKGFVTKILFKQYRLKIRKQVPNTNTNTLSALKFGYENHRN